MITTTFSLRTVLAIAALAATSASAQAADLNATFSFDSVASGTHANLAIGSASSLVHFDNARLFDDLDAHGDPIPGQTHWGIDTDYTAPVTVDNPLDYWRNAAPSGTNALNTAYGPVLMSFSTPLNLSNFAFTLENTGFGMPSADVFFLDATGHVVQTFSFAQDQSGATIQIGNIAPNVSAIVLPSGKFVDDVQVTTTSAVPEPESFALAMMGLGVLGMLRRRAKQDR